MASKAVLQIAEHLGVTPDAMVGLDACSEAEVAHLDSLVVAALEAEAESVDSGLRATLDAVPRPLRGRAKALLFPEDKA